MDLLFFLNWTFNPDMWRSYFCHQASSCPVDTLFLCRSCVRINLLGKPYGWSIEFVRFTHQLFIFKLLNIFIPNTGDSVVRAVLESYRRRDRFSFRVAGERSTVHMGSKVSFTVGLCFCKIRFSKVVVGPLVIESMNDKNQCRCYISLGQKAATSVPSTAKGCFYDYEKRTK